MRKFLIYLLAFTTLVHLYVYGHKDDERLRLRPYRHKRFVEMGPDIAGPYCAARGDVVCCPGRDDECTVPILGTLCYCDQFCNHTSFDCCPDYRDECGNQEPPVPSTREYHFLCTLVLRCFALNSLTITCVSVCRVKGQDKHYVWP